MIAFSRTTPRLFNTAPPLSTGRLSVTVRFFPFLPHHNGSPPLLVDVHPMGFREPDVATFWILNPEGLMLKPIFWMVQVYLRDTVLDADLRFRARNNPFSQRENQRGMPVRSPWLCSVV